MKRNRHILVLSLTALFLTLSNLSFSQIEKFNKALTLYNSKIPSNIDQAAVIIDSVVVDATTKSEPQVWTLRVAIYNDLHKRTEKLKLDSRIRDTVLSSVKMSNSFKPDSNQKAFNYKVVKNLAINYNNIAVRLLQDSLNYERSLIAYNRFKNLLKTIDPLTDFAPNDIQYNLAVASTYYELYGRDSSVKALETSKRAYQNVLESEPENKSANLGMGLLHYNQAANLSKSLDFETDITQLEVVQDNMVKLAKKSEQYILKVYNNDKKDKKAVNALYFIYRMLMDNEKHEEFKKKCTEMGIIVDETKPNPGK